MLPVLVPTRVPIVFSLNWGRQNGGVSLEDQRVGALRWGHLSEQATVAVKGNYKQKFFDFGLTLVGAKHLSDIC